MAEAPRTDPKDIQRAESFFQYGNDAAAKGNFPYAIDMYKNACQIAPLELKYRQGLRAAERRSFGNEPSKVGRLVGAKLQPIRLKIRAAKSRGHWPSVLEHCEEAFVHHPWDVGTSRDFAEAAVELGALDLARWAMESVQVQAAEDAPFWKHMAKVYETCQDYKRAILCWERVKRITPHDEEATHQIHSLSANATIATAGLKETGERADPSDRSGPIGAASGSAAEPAEDAKAQPELSPQERFEAAVKADPKRPEPYLELAAEYESENRLDDAKAVLARGLQTLPDHPELRDHYARVQIRRLRQAISHLEERLRARPDDAEAKSKLEALRKKLAEAELTDLQKRSEANPGDLALRLELGEKLAQAGRHDDAIAAFQAARSSPAHKIRALLGAGKSFEANGVPKLAERSYKDALKGLDEDEEQLKLELHYRLGRIYEQLGNLDSAEEHYNEVAALNYGYQDVAERLRSLNQRMSS